ncbi:MAG: iron-sulfur cluster assembly protein, partial [Nodosilinea sp.]
MSPSLTPDAVLEVLQPVQDPELQRSLVDLNMIRQVAI